MSDEYHRDLSHVTWDEVYERQLARDDYITRWLDEADVRVGDAVVEVGSGPGRLAIRAARRVGNSGAVYALDRQRDALAYLEAAMAEAGVGNVEPLYADAETLPLAFDRPVVVMLTYVLHHADRPERVLSELAGALPPESRLFVCEHHPDGPGEEGPPLDHRFPPERLRELLEDAGFDTGRTIEYENESYAFVGTRSTADSSP